MFLLEYPPCTSVRDSFTAMGKLFESITGTAFSNLRISGSVTTAACGGVLVVVAACC